jgi:hypothetical protein
MGGRILCRSSEGRGTIFMVLLPRRVANAQDGGRKPTDEKPGRRTADDGRRG